MRVRVRGGVSGLGLALTLNLTLTRTRTRALTLALTLALARTLALAQVLLAIGREACTFELGAPPTSPLAPSYLPPSPLLTSTSQLAPPN